MWLGAALPASREQLNGYVACAVVCVAQAVYNGWKEDWWLGLLSAFYNIATFGYGAAFLVYKCLHKEDRDGVLQRVSTCFSWSTTDEGARVAVQDELSHELGIDNLASKALRCQDKVVNKPK